MLRCRTQENVCFQKKLTKEQMDFSEHKKQRILFHHHTGNPTITKLLRHEGLSASRQGVAEFLKHFESTGTIKRKRLPPGSRTDTGRMNFSCATSSPLSPNHYSTPVKPKLVFDPRRPRGACAALVRNV